MGMTIDDVLAEYNAWKITISENVSPDCVDALDTAINTMRKYQKYQKIEQILKSLDDGEINYPQMTYYLREVLEDGDE